MSQEQFYQTVQLQQEYETVYNCRVAGERSSSKPTRAVCTVLAVSPHMLTHETVPVGFFVAGEPTNADTTKFD